MESSILMYANKEINSIMEKEKKEKVEELQFEVLCYLEEDEELSEETLSRLNYYSQSLNSKKAVVLATILTSDEFTKAFLKFTDCVTESHVERIKNHIIKAEFLASNIGVENLFYNDGHVELFMADVLGHDYNTKTRGFDAHNNGVAVEYKSINMAESINMADLNDKTSSEKNKGCFQFHWISKDKLDAYSKVTEVFFSLRKGAEIKEIWSLPMAVIYPDLVEKYNEAEKKRNILIDKGVPKKKNTDAHKSYSLNTLKNLGAKLVFKS